MIVNTALQEDVDAIGLSVLSGAHNFLFPKVLDLLREKDMQDVVVFGGGIIPDEDIEPLKQAGVKGLFTPGTPMQEIIDFIHGNIKPKS